jgi:hypothetical protein
MGFLPSVTKNPFKPKPFSILAFVSGPALAMLTKVSYPIALTILWNLLTSISAIFL